MKKETETTMFAQAYKQFVKILERTEKLLLEKMKQEVARAEK